MRAGPRRVECEFEAIYVDACHASRDDGACSPLMANASSRAFACFRLARRGARARGRRHDAPARSLAAVRLPLRRTARRSPPTGLVLVLHDVRDPGNAGTLVRSADAAGANGVVFTGQSVDPSIPRRCERPRARSFTCRSPCAALEDDARRRSARAGRDVLRDASCAGERAMREVDYHASRRSWSIGNEAEGLE